MSDQVIYLDRFRIRQGRLEDFKRYAEEIAQIVEEKEPGAVSFGYYIQENSLEGTAVFVFSGSQALDLHIDLLSERFQEGYELLSGSEIELLGQASDRATQMARTFNASIKTQLLAGFNRWRRDQGGTEQRL
jgi:hypothetical protein